MTNKKILIAMALEAECQGRFTKENVIYTGIGKVNASYKLTKSILENKPDLVINLGSAGSNFFKKGMVINCTKFIQRDMDVTPLGFKKWQTPFEGNDETTLSYGTRISHLKEGICGTGDNFDISHNEDAYNVVDMESYVFAKICQKEKMPFICLKYITDGADESAADDWNDSLKKASDSLFNEYKNLKINYPF